MTPFSDKMFNTAGYPLVISCFKTKQNKKKIVLNKSINVRSTFYNHSVV